MRKKKQKISKRTEVKNKDKGDTKAQWQEGKDQDVALRQPQKSVDQTPAPPQVKSDASEGKEDAALCQSKKSALKKRFCSTDIQQVTASTLYGW